MTADIEDADARTEMPTPFGVEAATGDTRPPLGEGDLDAIAGEDGADVTRRGRDEKLLAAIATVDLKDLSSTGWGIVFPANVDPAIVKALEPLIEHRRGQVNNPDLLKVFTGRQGVSSAAQSATDWLGRFGLGLFPVDPEMGVPYYLTLVGSPKEISFDFQYTLDLQWCVGRLCFDTPAEYEAYARSVVQYETASSVPHKKRVAMWMPRHQGDAATTMLTAQVGKPLAARGLGVKAGYKLDTYLAEKATKAQLRDILSGATPDGPPALLFTGSHGLEWSKDDPAGQRQHQGALITQDWTPRQPVGEDHRFTADDIPAGAKLHGMVHFLFACFGGGCPVTDTYRKDANGAPIALAQEPLVARLPQRMLSGGALAVMAHIDRAWSWSFQNSGGMPQDQVIRSTIDTVLAGLPVGVALDYFNLQWSTLAARLGMLQGQPKPPTAAALANLFIARDDARNYALFGDPAVRLRVADMSA